LYCRTKALGANTVTLRNLGMGIGGNLIAAAIVWYVSGPKGGLLVGGAGIVILIVTHFLTRKSVTLPPLAPPTVHQETKQEFNPQLNLNPQFNIGLAPALASAAPAPTPVTKREPRCNVHFTDVKLGNMNQNRGLLVPIGVSVPYAAAVFENKVIEGAELRIPTVKARAIYRRADGNTILDVSNVAWIPGPGNTYVTLEANTPRYLLLFSLETGNLLCWTVEPMATRIAGQRRMVPERQQYRIAEPVSSVEVQLLTEAEQVYRVVLSFVDEGSNALPQCAGFTES